MLICIILNPIPDREQLFQDSASGVSGMAPVSFHQTSGSRPGSLVSFHEKFGSGPGSVRPDLRTAPALYFQTSDTSFTTVTSTALRQMSSEPSAGFIQRPEVPSVAGAVNDTTESPSVAGAVDDTTESSSVANPESVSPASDTTTIQLPAPSGRRVSRLRVRNRPRFFSIPLREKRTEVTRLPDGNYEARQLYRDMPIALPGIYSFEEYSEVMRERNERETRLELLDLYQEMAEQESGGLLDFRISVPGGRESTFTTIFGRPEVNLQVNGAANMNLGASVQRTSDPSLPADQQTRIDPLFHQNLQLNIQGTIGDKLAIQTDWDTERTFDYQNLLNIRYSGYEDEIIQQIEMGNVSMQTGNSLIRGSGSLFGIRTDMTLGAMRLTSVLSQQKGESNIETITGGAQERPVRLQPADYEDNRHFFLDFYTRQQFEQSMENPQQRVQTLQLSDLNVWVLRDQVQADEGARLAVALADYGVAEGPDGSFQMPDNALDRFDEAIIDGLRDPSVSVTAGSLGLEDPRNLEEGYFTLLTEGVDYTVNPVSGYISLQRELGAREVLAISFSYMAPDGRIVNVGDVNHGSVDRLFLKMLKSGNPASDHRTFPLTMRNIYSLGASDLTPATIDLELLFTEGNVEQNRLPGRTSPMLQDLGLDRVDSQGSLVPDNQIDFGTGTLDAQSGRLIFPYLEPFGERLEEVLLEAGATAEELDQLVFRELYLEQKRNAERSSKNTFYRLDGRVTGGVQDHFTLDFALVEGSVRVFANGVELQEGTDYQVDYSFGSITILNERFTAPGQEIRIEYENQALTSIEQKSFTGVRAEYRLSNDIQLGGTWFRYHERPLDDKIRIGDEPISNMVFGLDANARFDAPFFTDALNAIPLLSTRESSEITFSGEFAHLQPGVARTRAMERAIRNDELYPDEVEGLSFIDDFEGSSVRINLLNPMRWNLAAAPAAVPGMEGDEIWFEEDLQVPATSPLEVQAARSDLRSKLSWYSIPRNISSILNGVDFTPESRPVRVQDVFPGRETHHPGEEFITTLDLFYDPTTRGPYNYNMNLRTLLEEDPERTWGGMTAVLPPGQEDFSQNNVEYLDFWVQPVLPGGEEAGEGVLEDFDGTLYIDIGTISEDVVPNARLNTEDGLALNPDLLIPDRPGSTRSWLPSTAPPPEGQFSTENRELEDVGLDGLPSSGGYNGLNEQQVFSDFLDAMAQQYGTGSADYRNIFRDPSNDMYVYYGESALENLPLHERFHRMMGYYEGNTPLEHGERRAVTNRPNSEGLVNPARVELNNAYFQYEIPFNPATLAGETPGDDSFLIDGVSGSRQEDRWFQFRIPLDEFRRQIGEIENFQNITYIRIWMSGYRQPFTLRFAALEFVGSQWQQAEQINQVSDPAASLRVSTINIEENSNRNPIPYRQPRGAIRARDRGTQIESLQNEQSIVLSVENLGADGLQLVRRNFPGGLNLLNYSNMRMFVHGEGFRSRGEAELVMRFGNDLENNFYEYRQPVTPSDPGFPWQRYDPSQGARLEEEAEQVWLYDENSMNIVLQAFNELKQLRDQEQVGNGSLTYERGDLLDDAPEGAVLAIRGNPSLDRVTEIGMGVRNPYDPDRPDEPGTPLLSAQLWLNELRVSGFDNESGWAANTRSTVRLADFATVNTHFVKQTDGFGSLDSRMAERRLSDQLAYDINSTFNMHRFIPERYGWSIPLTISARRSELTPRFLPNEGDIRLEDYISSLESRRDLSETGREVLINRRIRDVQTVSESHSVNLSNVTKYGSGSLFARYLLDNLTFNYIYNSTSGRSPQYRFQDNWNFDTSLRYAISFQADHYLRPLSFLESVPLAGLLSGLQLGVMPHSLTTSVRMNRLYEERRRRSYDAGDQIQPIQQTHHFNYHTLFGFGYNLTPSISTNFQSRTVFDLGRISQNYAGRSGVDSTAFNPVPTFQVLEDLLTSRSVSPRRSIYEEDYTASWQPRLSQIRPLNWVSYTLRYGGGFRWENAPYESGLGSTVSNSVRLDHNLRLDTGMLLDSWGWLQRLRQEGAGRGGLRGSIYDEDTEGESPDEEDPEDGPEGLESLIEAAGRRLITGLLSLRSVELSYNDAGSGSQTGYAGGSTLGSLIGLNDGFSPDFFYRTGFTRRIDQEYLIDHPAGSSIIQLPAHNRFSDTINLRARLLPFRNLSIDLIWTTQWDERITRSMSLDPAGTHHTVFNATGTISSSVWSFGDGYRDLFDRQLETAFENIDADTIRHVDGRGVLDRVTLQEDFRSAWLSGGGRSFGKRNFTPIPLPEWRVNWTGIEEMLPVLGRFMERLSLTHGYSGRYRLGWNHYNDPGAVPSRQIGDFAVEYRRHEYEPSTLSIEQRFAPLVQMNITWDRDIRTRIGYDHSRLTSMTLSNVNVTERISRGFTLSVDYTIRNFNVPFFRSLNNNLTVTLNGNLIEDSEQRFLLDADIGRALSSGPSGIDRRTEVHSISPRPPTGQTRINASSILGYRFSSTIQANLEYAFSRTIPKSSRTFERTTHDVRFSVRINFRSS